MTQPFRNLFFLLFLLPLMGQGQGREKPLREVAPFTLGTTLEMNSFARPEVVAIYRREFHRITCGNSMKIKGSQPTADTFDFTMADSIVNDALRHGQLVHGHTLIWGKSLPDWLVNFQGDSVAWEQIMKTRIQTVMRHFKGRIHSWDVVNEAFNDDGTMRTVVKKKGQKENLWCQKLGPDFVARCFQYAREADPDALLFYNDYGQEYSEAKNKAILRMISSFRKRGIPIDGIGLQLHTSLDRPDALILKGIRAMASTGLLVHISELDVSVKKQLDEGMDPAAAAKAQAAKYETIVKYMKSLPEKQQFGITLWGVTDADTWLKNDTPLLWDAHNHKKQAWYGFYRGLLQKP